MQRYRVTIPVFFLHLIHSCYIAILFYFSFTYRMYVSIVCNQNRVNCLNFSLLLLYVLSIDNCVSEFCVINKKETDLSITIIYR